MYVVFGYPGSEGGFFWEGKKELKGKKTNTPNAGIQGDESFGVIRFILVCVCVCVFFRLLLNKRFELLGLVLWQQNQTAQGCFGQLDCARGERTCRPDGGFVLRVGV